MFRSLNLYPTTSYLLEVAGGGYLLVDTSYEIHWGAFWKGLHRLGVAPHEIRYLLLTHHHDDHVGFAGPLLARTGARLIVHEAALPALAAGRLSDPLKAGVGRMLNRCTAILTHLHAVLTKRSFAFPPLHPRAGDLILQGEEALSLRSLGVAGWVLHTPGHSSDSISLVLEEGAAFVGDAAMNILPFCATRYRPIYAEDYDEVFRSWRRLIEAGVKHLYPAHGRPFGVEKLQQGLRRWG